MKKIQLLMLLFTLHACEVYGKHDPSNYILINEIKTYGVTDFSDEFIELFNVSDSLFNIGNYKILYYNG
ncbi:hypothetical protein GF337_07780, partial [candidate division KSB1 bacterium]|nr:hypothetical protein [candidate division KSB1 bacterium]